MRDSATARAAALALRLADWTPDSLVRSLEGRFDHATARWLVLVGVPLAIAVGLSLFLHWGMLLRCPFHGITHLYCPGCGSGRALRALMHLEVARAFRQNALFLPAILFLGRELARWYGAILFRRPILSALPIGADAYIRTTLVILAFWILRNIPFSPFSLLAPT